MRFLAAIIAFALGMASAVVASSPVQAQGIEVSPIKLVLAPGQTAATLTVTNHGDHSISFQIRGFSWQQGSDSDTLAPSAALAASPPIATIAAGGSQVVRLILRQPPGNSEASYRILFDQLPPPHEAGVVRVLLRLSIPVFAEPRTQVTPRVHWSISREQGHLWLVAVNDGSRHLTVGNLKLYGPDGRAIDVEMMVPPHILAGSTRRWPVANLPLPPGSLLRLTGTADVGVIDERVRIDSGA